MYNRTEDDLLGTTNMNVTHVHTISGSTCKRLTTIQRLYKNTFQIKISYEYITDPETNQLKTSLNRNYSLNMTQSFNPTGLKTLIRKNLLHIILLSSF